MWKKTGGRPFSTGPWSHGAQGDRLFSFFSPNLQAPRSHPQSYSWAKMLAGASSVSSTMQAGGEKQGGGETGLPLHLLSRTLHGSPGQPLLRASLHGPKLRHLTAFSCKGGREASSSGTMLPPGGRGGVSEEEEGSGCGVGS